MGIHKMSKFLMGDKKAQILQSASAVFETESKQILNLKNQLTDDFVLAVESILESSGKLIITGMGKSGIIGKKIAATMASTGTPSFFLHPGEAYHGDLGMIEPKDVVLLISNSGETDEVLKLIPFLQSQGNTTISITNNRESTLGKNTDFFLDISIEKEGCPLNLAPMSSTSATLVMGDALAACLMEQRGFRDVDFAKFHPGGSLGRKLLSSAKDIMKSDLPIINDVNVSVKELIHTISDYGLGLCLIANENKEVIGLITDGDIRRYMDDQEEKFFALKAGDIMNTNPICIDRDAKLSDIEKTMHSNKVQSLIVCEDKKILGVVQIYDI